MHRSFVGDGTHPAFQETGNTTPGAIKLDTSYTSVYYLLHGAETLRS